MNESSMMLKPSNPSVRNSNSPQRLQKTQNAPDLSKDEGYFEGGTPAAYATGSDVELAQMGTLEGNNRVFPSSQNKLAMSA